MKPPATVADIKAYREQTGASMHEAVRFFRKIRLLKAVDDAETVEDLKEILHEIINVA